jgi:hypothetical protein
MKKITFFLVILCLFGCEKKNNSPERAAQINPFAQYLSDNGAAVSLTLHNNDYPLEIGYTFTAADTGIINQIGLRLPGGREDFFVTLWDAQTQKLLVQKQVHCFYDSAFSYIDLAATNESVGIQASRTYLISVNLTPAPGAIQPVTPLPINYYDVRRTDQKDIFPMTESYITYLHQYNKITTSPAFPDNLITYQDFINGIVDIGFSHVTK